MNAAPTTRYQWLAAMRTGGAVQRYHTSRMLRQQDVSAHSWGVAMVLLAMGVGNVAALAYSLLHDEAEQATGDIPAVAKWDFPHLKDALSAIEQAFEERYGINEVFNSLSAEDVALVKYADMYELCQHCLEDAQMGNTHVHTMLNNGLRALDKRLARVQAVGSAAVKLEAERLHAALFNEAQPYVTEE